MPTYLTPGVYVEEIEAGARPIEGVGTAVAAFVGFAADGPFNTPTLVSNWTQFTQTFGDFVEGCYLAQSVYGYFLNGGANCYIVRIGGPRDRENGAAAKAATRQAVLGGYRFVAKELTSGGQPGELTVEVTEPSGENPGDDRFTVLVKKDGKVVETHNVTTKRTKENVVTLVREKSSFITIEELATGGAVAKPDRGTAVLTEPPQPPPVPRRIAADDYVGDVADRTGFGGLEAIDEITMVAVPDLMAAHQRDLIDLDGVKAVQLAMIAHCELMGDRMAIVDPPPGLTPQDVRTWRMDQAGYDSKYAALYYPWVQVLDAASGTNTFVPPSGYMAGVWARTDATRGVHKAPANEVVRGVLALETQLTKAEQELLNPIGVNCVRSFMRQGHPHLGSADAVERPGVALPQRAAAVQLPRRVDPQRHPVGRVRAERRRAVGPHPAHDQRFPGDGVAQGRVVRPHSRRGLLREMRPGDQPGRGDRSRPGDLRSGHRAGETGGVRDLPAGPDVRRHQPGQRIVKGLRNGTSRS